MKRRVIVAMLAIASLSATTALSKTYIISQTGGYAGLATLGVGYDFKYYSSAIMMGYVPAVVGGEDLWSTTIRNQVQYGVVHVGVANHFSHDRDTFWRLPGKYPREYYPPSGIMSGPYAGIHVAFGNGFVFYSEVTSLDYYLEMKMRNPNYISWLDVITYAFGVYWYL